MKHKVFFLIAIVIGLYIVTDSYKTYPEMIVGFVFLFGILYLLSPEKETD